ncbi:MAG: DUF2378 family protein [Myxococcota bacterium]
MSSREHDVTPRVFDGLFHGEWAALREVLKAELCAAGYDAATPRPGWPVGVWRAVLDVVRRHALADLPEADGLRELGRRFAKGFGQTPVGWVFTAVAPLIGPERALFAVPRYLHTARKHMKVTVDVLGEGHARLTALDDEWPRAEPPDFLAGCIEAVLLAAGVAPRVAVSTFTGGRLELDVRW